MEEQSSHFALHQYHLDRLAVTRIAGPPLQAFQYSTPLVGPENLPPKFSDATEAPGLGTAV